MKKISILTPCYNEESNVADLYSAIKKVFQELLLYEYEHVFIDNASTDKTVNILKQIALEDKNVKIIVNARNFGHIRSPFYGLLQCTGDAVISLCSDFQDPPSLIPEFIQKWEAGSKIVIGIKRKSCESKIMFLIRSFYYKVLQQISETDQIEHFTGFGLYDKEIIKILGEFKEPYPYMRGIIAEIGYDISRVDFTQPKRQKGITKNNFYTLYDMAMTAFVNYSKVPIRLATLLGFFMGMVSFIVAVGYFVYKLLFWSSFEVGMAPLVIGFFLLSSVQLFFIGIIGEYIGAIFTQVKNRPLVIERERINF